jgi:hypothetical protein
MAQITPIDRHFSGGRGQHDVEHRLGGIAVADHMLFAPDRGVRAIVDIDFWARPIQVSQFARNGGAVGRSGTAIRPMDVLPGMNAGVSIFATPSPIEGSRVAEDDVGRLGIEPSAAKAYPSPA